MSGVTKRRVLAGFMLLAIFMVALVLRPQPSDLVEWIDESGGWGPVLFCVLGVLLMSTCVPKTVMSILAGSMFGAWIGTALMLVIATTAAGINFRIGAWWWGDARQSTNADVQRDDDSASELESLDAPAGGGTSDSWRCWIAQVANEAGFGTHLLIRLSPVPTMLISYGCGAAGSRWWPYLGAAAVAVIPQSLWVIAGSTAADATLSPSAVRGPTKWISVGIAVFAAIVVSVWIPSQFTRQIRASSQPPLR